MGQRNRVEGIVSKYDAIAARAAGTIAEKGADVSFPGTATGGTYDWQTDTFTGPGSADATGKAVQVEGDPDRFAALGLKLVNPVSLMIAAHGLTVTPVPGMPIVWAGKSYTLKDVEPVAPDGTPIIYVATGSTS